MGKDKDAKKEKLEKKRLKAQIKLDKKRKYQSESEPSTAIKTHNELGAVSEHEGDTKTVSTTRTPGIEPPASTKHNQKYQEIQKSLPWYKDPAWIRALAAVITMVVAITALYFQVLR